MTPPNPLSPPSTAPDSVDRTGSGAALRALLGRDRPSGPRVEATDGELLALFVRRRDEAAFARLVERHAPMVWRVTTQVLRNPHDAEDAFQATFLLLARKARVIRASDSAAGWLYRVAHRTALAARRRTQSRRERPLESEPLSEPESEFPDLLSRRTLLVLMQELAALPTKYQTALVMRYLQGRSRRAIAEATDTTLASVQGRLARGKKLLRGRLVRRGLSMSAAMAALGFGASGAHAMPAKLSRQTTTHASALVHGGTTAAGAGALALYREGARAMFYTSLTKSAGAAAGVAVVALMIAVPPTVGDGVSTSDGEAPFVLSAAIDPRHDDPRHADPGHDGPVQVASTHDAVQLAAAAEQELTPPTAPTPPAPPVQPSSPQTQDFVMKSPNALSMQELEGLSHKLMSAITLATNGGERGMTEFLRSATPEEIKEKYPGPVGDLVLQAKALFEEIPQRSRLAALADAQQMIAEVRTAFGDGEAKDPTTDDGAPQTSDKQWLHQQRELLRKKLGELNELSSNTFTGELPEPMQDMRRELIDQVQAIERQIGEQIVHEAMRAIGSQERAIRVEREKLRDSIVEAQRAAQDKDQEITVDEIVVIDEKTRDLPAPKPLGEEWLREVERYLQEAEQEAEKALRIHLQALRVDSDSLQEDSPIYGMGGMGGAFGANYRGFLANSLGDIKHESVGRASSALTKAKSVFKKEIEKSLRTLDTQSPDEVAEVVNALSVMMQPLDARIAEADKKIKQSLGTVPFDPPEPAPAPNPKPSINAAVFIPDPAEQAASVLPSQPPGDARLILGVQTGREAYPEQNRRYGHSVEELQAKLNEVLDPSPDLAVDGDYGPLTASAVKRFQEENGMEPTGIAGETTREKLGLVKASAKAE